MLWQCARCTQDHWLAHHVLCTGKAWLAQGQTPESRLLAIAWNDSAPVSVQHPFAEHADYACIAPSAMQVEIPLTCPISEFIGVPIAVYRYGSFGSCFTRFLDKNRLKDLKTAFNGPTNPSWFLMLDLNEMSTASRCVFLIPYRVRWLANKLTQLAVAAVKR